MAGRVRRVELRPDYSASRIPDYSSASLINCYASGEKGKGAFPVVGVPGWRLAATLGGPIRGLRVENGVLFAVAGQTLYTVNSAFVATSVGAISGTDMVEFDRNRFQLGIIAEGRWFVYTFATGALTEIVGDEDNGFTGATSLAVIKGTGVYIKPNGDEFGITGIDSFSSLNPLDFATAESRADPLVAARALDGQVILFGSTTIELYTYTGDEDFPFGNAGTADVGAVSRDTIRQVGRSMMWLGRETSSQIASVYMSQGYAPVRNSTPTIDRLIQANESLEGSYAVTWGIDGHLFYTLVLPNGAATFDVLTGLWYQAASGVWDLASTVRSWGIKAQARFGEKIIFGDEAGRLLIADYSGHSEAGQPLVRELITSPFGSFGRASIVHELELEIEHGKGTLTVDPEWLMQFSTDGGHTWSQPEGQTSGKLGEYRRRLVWRSLGHGSDWAFRFRLTDDGPFHITGAWVSVEEMAIP